MSILQKALLEIEIDDLKDLCINEARENSELEFKETLPFQPQKGHSQTEDRWIEKGDRVGDFARDKLLSELIAFLNADGGTLVLGIVETEEEPRRAKALKILPDCEGLARRLLDACEDVIEPRPHGIAGRALPSDRDGSGYVILRASKSANGPHRLTTDGQYYIRRGERSVKMTAREIREKVLELARSGDAIAAQFAERREAHDLAFDRMMENRADPDRSQVIGISVCAFPASSWAINNLTARSELWWAGGPFAVQQGEVKWQIDYPAREFSISPEIRLRSFEAIEGADGLHRRIRADGLVEFKLLIEHTPDSHRARPESMPLFLDWVVGLFAGTIGQIDTLKRNLARDGEEFGIQLLISSNYELHPSWGKRYGGGSRAAEFSNVDFPKLSTARREDFDEVVNLALRDIWNHVGINPEKPIVIQWGDLLPE